MTGLDKIIEKIAQDSRDATEEILAAANAQTSEILNESKKKADAETAKILAEADEQAKRKIAAARASAESITRTRYLEVKNAIVNDVIAAAFEKVESMDDEAYFDLLFKLCVKNIEKGECKLFLNARDLARLPSDFEERLNKEVFETAAVQVAKQPKNIENGFVLVYGDMEVNCTLRAVFDSSMDALKDLLGPMLFD